MRVTVVTVCFNAANILEDTIQSVVNQTYDDLEYIIIDGGSTDGTVAILKKYSDKLSYWVSEKDKGIYDAMNKGITSASGDYINFMNAGDSFVSEDTVREFVEKIDSDYDIIYGDTIFKAPSGEYRRKTLPLNEIRHRMPFGHQSTFIKAELMKLKMYDTKFKSSGDYNFFFQCYEEKRKFLHIPMEVAKYENGSGMSIDNYRIVLKENALITGDIHNPFWGCKYLFTVFYKDMKRYLKKFIPQKLLLFRQKRIIYHKYEG